MPARLSNAELSQQVQSAAHAAMDLLFPPRCAGCGKLGADFCADCIASLSPVGVAVCAICGEPLEQLGLCVRCRRHSRAFHRVRSAFRFEGNLRQAVHAFKYQKQRRLARPLADLMGQVLEPPQDGGAILCAVPLHPTRLAERGFNQSHDLARHLAQCWNLASVSETALQRMRETQTQVGLDFVSRQANVGGAFTVEDSATVAGQVIILVDDVCTTGATLDACAKALLASGAFRVEGVTLARQI